MTTKIVSSGYYGFANAGDEAMLSAIVGSLLALLPDAEITVITGNPAATAKSHGVKTVHRFNVFAIISALSRCDLLISGGGSLLQDVTSSRSIYYYLGIIQTAIVFKRPVMLYAQGIGPVTGTLAKNLVKTVLQHVDVIGVRDEDSQETLVRMGVTRPPVHVTADAVLSVPVPAPARGVEILAAKGVSAAEKKVAVAFRDWQSMKNHKGELARAVDRLTAKEKCRIIFIPMQYPADVGAAKEIASLMAEDAIVLEEAYNTEEFMSLMGAVDLVIANRLHALVFAAVMNTPMTAVSYDPKIDAFMTLIGGSICCTMEDFDSEHIVTDAVTKLMHKSLPQPVRERIEDLERRSRRNAALAGELIRKTCHQVTT